MIGAALTNIPSISNIAWGTSGTSPAPAYFALTHYLDSVTNSPSLVIASINTVTGGSITWATMVPGSTGIIFETVNQPHLV